METTNTESGQGHEPADPIAAARDEPDATAAIEREGDPVKDAADRIGERRRERDDEIARRRARAAEFARGRRLPFSYLTKLGACVHDRDVPAWQQAVQDDGADECCG
jgi:hypothetical protein